MSLVYVLVLACGAVALLYGAYAVRSVLAADAGTERMQEIAGAVQEGARAYLNRQYMTIAAAGIVIGVLLGWRLGVTVAMTLLFRLGLQIWVPSADLYEVMPKDVRNFLQRYF